MVKRTFEDLAVTAFAVYKYRSLPNAAQRLSMTPGGISRRVSALEQELGFKLFVRGCDKRGMRCTDEGWLFFNSESEVEG